ncbi:hypothetical protein K6W16_22270 [Burkholderia dolosa]|uniref:Uncharacterized protein n=1 Tax=Burkholderia dolosa TaxID=152500 RepID=A0A892I4Y3_9BURK|nr:MULTISPECIES: hypothetical protein [Burkholderia]AKE05751.1 membrane protein [Burkholderia cepacia]AJY09575.1 putative membrane protein [Burkholderia dolosa AU0158]AYZ93918.1 hypothetical protein EGY28_01705 [Burkholderia dolosa]EAY70353.1 hypothetical protein BDAG_03147 [Burkholderia dolosa AU0158]ETP62344.1 hypothetical protein BDSB_18425 [Burkholderia dolosa PC543]
MNGLLHDRSADIVALGALAVLYFGALGIALWRIRVARRGRPYWIACIALLTGGAVAMAGNLSPMPNSGEMPPGFGLGVEAILLGLALVAAGCAWLMLRATRR